MLPADRAAPAPQHCDLDRLLDALEHPPVLSGRLRPITLAVGVITQSAVERGHQMLGTSRRIPADNFRRDLAFAQVRDQTAALFLFEVNAHADTVIVSCAHSARNARMDRRAQRSLNCLSKSFAESLRLDRVTRIDTRRAQRGNEAAGAAHRQ